MHDLEPRVTLRLGTQSKSQAQPHLTLSS